MIWIRNAAERLNRWQESPRCRILLTLIIVVAGALLFAPLAWKSFQFAHTVEQVAAVLREANAVDRNPQAIQLLERGSVTIAGREIGSARVQALAPQFFDERGRIVEVDAVASLVGSVVAPQWAPQRIIENPWLVTGIAVAAIALAVVAVWVGLVIHLVGLLVIGTCFLVPLWFAGQLGPMVAVGGIVFLFFAFFLLVRLALALLSQASPVCGIAHTLLIESVRQRISLGFIGTLLVILPLIPLWIDSREPLRYQVQTFLSRGTSLVFIFAAGLTLFLSSATVAFEIRDRQIWNVLTKPVSRFQYLAGKLLGLSMLNAIVLIVGGTAVFVYVEYLSTRQAADIADAAALRDQVLVAREVAHPAYEQLQLDQLRDIVDRTIARDSVLQADIAEGRRYETEVRRDLQATKNQEFLMQQRTIEPGKARKYVFSGLDEARRAGADPVLRYKFHIGRDDSHETFPALFVFGETPPAMVNYVPVQRNVFAIPANAISADGSLTIEVVNGGLTRDRQFYPGTWSLNFDYDGLEVLHRVGGFEGNYARALLVDWSKLVFISALGIAAGSVLSFPVAVLLAFTVFISCALSSYLGIALENYYVEDKSDFITKMFQYTIRGIAGTVRVTFAPFARSGGTDDLVNGQVIPWLAVFKTFGLVGVLWSAIAFAVGFLGFRRKEIAVYSGNN
ncbi:MAG: ABC transporter permease [Phycisphaerales bacterium]|nr:ABC transporter permease [Phycisphaerales bacterium]